MTRIIDLVLFVTYWVGFRLKITNIALISHETLLRLNFRLFVLYYIYRSVQAIPTYRVY